MYSVTRRKYIKNQNFEIKARIDDIQFIRRVLSDDGAKFIGTDHQVDTYFRVSQGRLKIREGTIENCIVWYNREDTTEPKKCEYHILQYEPGSSDLVSLKDMLCASLGILVCVEKTRDIFFVDNVKIHLDTVPELGEFVEIEAIGSDTLDQEMLRKQCAFFLNRLDIKKKWLIRQSYSDLLMEKNRIRRNKE